MEDMSEGKAIMIEVVQGDITKLEVNAIVNAANSTLLGGGGVDGAIHRAAGPRLLGECAMLMGCRTGDAKITKGYKLPAKHVIHTVGPVWHGGKKGEPELLESCYRNSLRIAIENQLRTIAFPSISTGVYRYPIAQACRIALSTTMEFLESDDTLKKVIFVCFSAGDLDTYQAAFREIQARHR
jgi:O-acetyl-ADP-ribose deacetylase (regulator of RNase III)